MQREIYHPNASLARVKNVSRGLKARTKILNVLEKHSAGASDIAKEASMHYEVATHHLKLLRLEGIVERKGRRPYVWSVTGLGQKRLTGSN